LLLIHTIVIMVLLLASGIFSGAETAMFALPPVRVERLEREGRTGSSALAALLRKPARLLTIILIGDFVTLVLITTLTTSLFLKYFSAVYLPLAMLVISTGFVIVGEIIPKSVAARQNERMALILAPIIKTCGYIFVPLRVPLQKFSEWVLPPGTYIDSRRERMTLERLSALVEMSHRAGELGEVEREMLVRTLAIGNRRVREIMVPRVEMVSMDVETDMEGAVGLLKESGFSRIPVYQEAVENIVGVLYLKDILPLRLRGEQVRLERVMRAPYFVPENKPIINLMVEFQVKARHIAFVVDEYGVLSGMVTLEDIVEEVVGDIIDPRTVRREEYQRVSPAEYIVYAALELDRLNRLLGLSLDDQYTESVGGWIISRLGRIPQEGEHIRLDNLHITVLESAPNRLVRLYVRKVGGR